MKIAIPMDEKSKKGEVASVFGRASHFLIYDRNEQSYIFLENEAKQRPGGAGVQAAQLLVDAGAQVVLAPQCGANALQVLEGAKIKIYRCKPGPAQDNLDAFLEGKLQALVDGEW
ncbi:MAG: dinitrogenase iron-molybdenum cofactor biosynthesis protein [Firmicutes bacterium]|nr:dinitrogenase iron-molybdenum cofactor biosynthesis protein [Bacillota bacterium]